MKIGMSLTTAYPLQRDSGELLASLTEQVKLMAELGFDSLSLGDHHLTTEHYIQVLPAISHMAASPSGRLRSLSTWAQNRSRHGSRSSGVSVSGL